MYLSFYNLEKKPFQISTDPEFLWLGEKHKEALAVLKYGILDNMGFLLLTGDVGTGKTTLINGLVNDLGEEVVVARVPDPGMTTIDFMNFISHVFGMDRNFRHKDAFLIHFGSFLDMCYSRQKKVLLIIDESQRLSQSLLEEVRQLSNIERPEAKLLNIFLIGQNEFNDVLVEPQNRALRQRVAISYSLSPLDLHETGELIMYRLKVAGGEDQIFSSEAISEIYDVSGGIPRKINILCDHCLIAGYLEGTKKITASMVKTCAREFNLSAYHPKNDDTTVWARVKDASGTIVTDRAARVDVYAEDAVVHEYENMTDTRCSVRRGFGGVAALVLALLLIGYGFSLPGNKEVVVRFVDYGWQFIHTAYMSNSAFFNGGRRGATDDFSTVGKQKNAATISSGEAVVGDQKESVLPAALASPPATEEEPVQFYTEADTPSQELLTGSVLSSVNKISGSSVVRDVLTKIEATQQPYVKSEGEKESNTVAADSTTSEPLMLQKSDKNFAEIFPNMDRYLSEKDWETEKNENGAEEQQRMESIDSGKVIDWLVNKKSNDE